MSNRQRKRLSELDKLSSAELKDQLNSMEGKSKGVRSGRRRLKAALKKAEEREEYAKGRQEQGDKKASERPECIKVVRNPDDALDGEMVAYFENMDFSIKRGNYMRGNFIIEKDNQRVTSADSYEEAVKKAYSIIERQKQ